MLTELCVEVDIVGYACLMIQKAVDEMMIGLSIRMSTVKIVIFVILLVVLANLPW